MRQKVTIIAEAGVNHNGDFEKAIQLIEAASDAGADYVKFQTFKADSLVQQNAQKADYQVQNTKDEGSQYQMLKNLEIPAEWYPKLLKKAQQLGIGFLSTGFDEESIDFLTKLGCDFFKIPSGEITNKPYLQHIAEKKKPVIISTGMSDMNDIRNAISIFTSNGIALDKITVLHCNTQYPTEMKDVNLLAMLTIKDEFNVDIGYSDHTLGIEVPIAATALGAKVIEKHFTLDRNLPGPDHLASLTPEELKEMVKSIRNIELAISGSGEKKPSLSERQNIAAARKSIHWAANLKQGSVIQREHLVMLRPGDGISPMKIDDLIGKTTSESIQKWDKVKWEQIN